MNLLFEDFFDDTNSNNDIDNLTDDLETEGENDNNFVEYSHYLTVNLLRFPNIYKGKQPVMFLRMMKFLTLTSAFKHFSLLIVYNIDKNTSKIEVSEKYNSETDNEMIKKFVDYHFETVENHTSISYYFSFDLKDNANFSSFFKTIIYIFLCLSRSFDDKKDNNSVISKNRYFVNSFKIDNIDAKQYTDIFETKDWWKPVRLKDELCETFDFYFTIYKILGGKNQISARDIDNVEKICQQKFSFFDKELLLAHFKIIHPFENKNLYVKYFHQNSLFKEINLTIANTALENQSNYNLTYKDSEIENFVDELKQSKFEDFTFYINADFKDNPSTLIIDKIPENNVDFSKAKINQIHLTNLSSDEIDKLMTNFYQTSIDIEDNITIFIDDLSDLISGDSITLDITEWPQNFKYTTDNPDLKLKTMKSRNPYLSYSKIIIKNK